MSLPLISVVITSYNDGLYIDEAVKSVESSSYRNFEILIVDDCSTDQHTIDRLNALAKNGYNVIRKKSNQGLGDSRNLGIKNSKGTYILPLDADDLIHSSYLEKAVNSLEKGFAIAYCNVKSFGHEISERIAPPFSIPVLLSGNFIASCSAFKKSAWEMAGGFDVTMDFYEDWEFWVKLAKNGATFIHINETLFEYRRKPSSMISRAENPFRRAEMVKYVCKKHLDLYQQYVPEIVSTLHIVISDLEKDLKTHNGNKTSAELHQRIKSAEDELLRKTEYYESSFFWKLKKITDKLRGK
jgi:glycosyltransferase involved in cell wall biosynthesis